MDGLINFHKAVGITSAKALYKVRAITRPRKSGHAGTLDPAAEGVLILCLGRATKLVEQLMEQPKVYRATARLDVTSVSFDSDGPLTPVPVRVPPDREAVRAALMGFEGTIAQVPPAISALKVGGVPAYKRARRNQPLALAARPVEIYWLRLSSYQFPDLEFEMCCGRGAYVRGIIRDLGLRLGTGGCLTSLMRTRIGPFRVEDAVTLHDLSAAKHPDEYLIPLEQAALLLAKPVVIPLRPL